MRASADNCGAEERILDAAVEMFSKFGFSGASTRGIARLAKVNEASIYRYFAGKRALFTAALDRELQQLRPAAGRWVRIRNTADPREAIGLTFQFLADAVAKQPESIRLLHFGVLEFGPGITPVCRKHFGEMIAVTSNNLKRWSEQDALPRWQAEVTVLGFLATMILVRDFYEFFAGTPLAHATAETVAATCADVWCSVIARGGAASAKAAATADLHSNCS
jgi:AcrR family transcriptional regulator